MRLLFSLILIAFLGCTTQSFARTAAANPADCDTLYTSDGKYYLVHLISQTATEVQFSLCADASSVPYTLPIEKVARTSRIVTLPEGATTLDVTATPGDPMRTDPLVRKARNASTLAIIAMILMCTVYLSIPAVIMAIIAVINGERLLRQIKSDHKYGDYIRRKARKAVLVGMLALLIPFGLYFLFGPVLGGF
jgi:hypothetical protein